MKETRTEYQIHDVLKRRWSPRAFADKEVTREVLNSLFEAARWSPSCYNDQPWQFIVATKENEEGFQKAFNALVEFNQNWARFAPVLVIAYARKSFVHNNKPNAWTEYDLGQAVAHLTFEAASRGLYLHQMGGFSEEKVKSTFDIGEEYVVKSMIAIGYLGDKNILPDDLKKSEDSQRKRKDLNEVVKFV